MKLFKQSKLKLIFILFFLISVSVSYVNAGLDYKPPEQEPITVENPKSAQVPDSLSILIWNIGYCGLGAEADFFMDGGKSSLAESKTVVEEHFKNIKKFIKDRNADIILLQEVDEDAKRSYGIKQVQGLKSEFKDYSSGFAYNYKVPFVPVPLKKPMGRVKSGLLTLSRFDTLEMTRYSLPGEYSWPTRVFHLDRCILVSVIPIEKTRKRLIVINMHLSAFDKGGELRKQQLTFLKEFILLQYEMGNFVIVGGDWNHSFPGFQNTFSNNKPDPDWLQYLPNDWSPEGWKFYFDKNNPTIRANSTPYVKGDNFRTIIDGFLVSPNVMVNKVQGFDLDFQDSDHNPVLLEVTLNPEEIEELPPVPEDINESKPKEKISGTPECRNINDIEKFDTNTVCLIGIYRISEEKVDLKLHKKVFQGTYLELEDGTKVILSYMPPEAETFKDKKVKIIGTIYRRIPPDEEYMQRIISPHLKDYNDIEIIE
ncbi:MAG: endonuclease/exonuclease/phosphatase family protein [bacterium]|nr:endonuclease/exonuclease/phosphatase family protein [bacterium]